MSTSINIKTPSLIPPAGWQRPTEWIAIPAIAAGEEVFYGLVAVYDIIDGNRVAFTFAGNYTVDWGDGSALELVSSEVKAQHLYDFSTVVNPTSEGWRQALIKVIPTGAANITTVNLQAQVTGIANGKTSQFMDIVMSVPNVTGAAANLVIGNGNVVIHRVVERIDIRAIGAINTMNGMFQNCSSLQSVPLFNTANVTTMSTMFFGCSSLQSVPLFNTSIVINMSLMFLNCNSLQSVPLFNTPIVTNMQQMFVNCVSLQTVPLFNTGIVSNMIQMFQGCTSLQSVPLFNTASLTNMNSMFSICSGLQQVPLFNTSIVTAMNSVFQGCNSLYEAEFNMASVTGAINIFLNAGSLQRFTATGLTRGVSLINNLMSATELNNFFTSLGTAVTPQTIIVTGNPGAATCDTTIATTKGFTVTI